jgi:hypothetical protein
LIATNPFSTCRVRPGAIPFFFSPGDSAARLIDRLAANGWWGEIIGPHGSGKSTLVATLLGELRQCGRRPVQYQLHDDEWQLPRGWQRTLRLAEADMLVVDGYEKISHWGQFWIERTCRRFGCGLVVTAHSPAGLPELVRTEVSPEIARRVVRKVLNGDCRAISMEDVHSRLVARSGDLRETLFDLYDLFERLSRHADSADEAA